MNPRALIAEDEPLLARALRRELARLWPELQVIGTPEDGPAAAALALRELPDVLFIDVQMPGATGLDVAAEVADEWPEGRPLPLLVFVTAFDQYAVQAFERAAIDYLVKPVAPERMVMTVERLRQRVAARGDSKPGDGAEAVKAVMSAMDAAVADARVSIDSNDAPLPPADRIRVLRAAVGNRVKLIRVEEVVCFEAADKYVNVVTETEESLVRLSLRELAARIEGIELVQIHRGILVNAARMLDAERDESGHYWLSVRGLRRPLKVSRAFSHLFRPM
jgi:DNA-binding LytR/AlgR family response regulator